MHMGKGSMVSPNLLVSGRDGWGKSRIGGSTAFTEYMKHFATKGALAMTEEERLIRKLEREIIHDKPSLDPLCSMAT